MARSTTGSFVLNYGAGTEYEAADFGSLISFDFACGDACTKTTSDAAKSCELSVTASCVYINNTGDGSNGAYEYTETYSYAAPTTGLRKAPMVSAVWNPNDGAESEPNVIYQDTWCFNYTFVATSADGKTPFLYLDTVVGAYYYTQNS